MSDIDKELPRGMPEQELLARVLRLAKTPGVLGAFLLHDAVIVGGQSTLTIADIVHVRVFHNLAFICYDLESQMPTTKSKSPAAHVVVGDFRFVVSHLGPRETRYMLGVAVMQAEPVAKSLQRLIRQIDRDFRRSFEAKNELPAVAICSDDPLSTLVSEAS